MLIAWGALALVATFQSAQPDPVIIDVRIGRIAAATVRAYRVGSEVLLPVSQLFDLIEIRHRLSPQGRLEGAVEPGNRRVVIDIRGDNMELGDHAVPIGRKLLWLDAGELYVGSQPLADLLGVVIEVDWSDLTATIIDPAALPIVRRLHREARRAAYEYRSDSTHADLRVGLEHPSWDGVVLDYSVLAPSTDPVSRSTYAVGLGADVGGGSLEIVGQNVGMDRVHVDASWTGVWRDRSLVKQLRIGDVPSTGPRSRALQGVAITNAPFVRPSVIGSVRYGGALEPGWSIEAYQGGELVAFDSALSPGGFAIDLPVRYGENPVDFVAYGPLGQVRTFNRTYRVLAEVLPAGRFEYGLSGGRCPPLPSVLQCRGTANLDLRYGVTRRWTVQGGADQFWGDSLPTSLHPYGVLTGNPTNSWVIESELVGGASARGALRYEPSIHFRVGGEYIQYARDAAPVFTGPGRQAQWSVAGFLRPGRDQGYFFLDGRVDQIRTATGALTRSRLGASIQTSAMRLLPYARTEGRREFVGVATFIMPRPQWGQVLSQVLLRTTTEVERLGGVVSWSAFAARPVAPGLRLEVGANWQRGVAGATYTVNLTTYVAAVRAVTFMVAPPGEAVSGTQYLQGSVLWDRRTGRLGVAPGPALQRAGLAGRVFLDKNANGIRDPDEPGISQAHVLIGSRTAATDADGLYHVWDLVPFEPVMVSIDSLSLDSPLLVPLFTRTSIVPGPNRYRTLDIPLIEAGVIEGRVTRSGAGVGGVTLILFDRGRNVRRTLTTFSDGGFYLMGVKPGDYELFVPVNVLDALGADALPVRFTLKSTAGGVGRSDLEVQLKPRF